MIIALKKDDDNLYDNSILILQTRIDKEKGQCPLSRQ